MMHKVQEAMDLLQGIYTVLVRIEKLLMEDARNGSSTE
jgi:hypothetical protein